jgi:hypothetical protein
MLPLPRVPKLGPRRRNGLVCVWCRGEAEVDLGPRIGVVRGRLERFFPRACRSCVRAEAERVHNLHARTCHRCAPGQYCPDRRALYALAHQTGDAP